MQKFLISIIKIYQKMPINSHFYCRHIPTCSQYAIEAITEYGVIKGSFLSIKRILKCNPFGTHGYDPIIKKEEVYEKNN